MTSLAHMTSHTIRPACLTQIHRSATFIAFTRAPNPYLPCSPDITPCRLCISRHHTTAPHQLIILVTIKILQVPIISACRCNLPYCSSLCLTCCIWCHPLRSRLAAVTVDHAPPINTHMTCHTKP